MKIRLLPKTKGMQRLLFTIIAGIFIIGAALITVWPSLVGVSNLKLVDVVVVEKDEEFPKLDIKLRNAGNKTTYVNKVLIHVIKIWCIKNPHYPTAVAISKEYDINLPVEGFPYTRSLNIDQSIESNQVDRFVVTLGNDAPRGGELYVFLIEVELLYDENERIKCQSMLFATNSATMVLGFNVPIENSLGHELWQKRVQEFQAENSESINEIRGLEATKSERVIELLR